MSGVQAAISNADGRMPFVTAFMRSSLNATAVDYDFLATQGVHAEHVMVDVLAPASLLARLGQRSIDYVNVRGRHSLRPLAPAHSLPAASNVPRTQTLQPPPLGASRPPFRPPPPPLSPRRLTWRRRRSRSSRRGRSRATASTCSTSRTSRRTASRRSCRSCSPFSRPTATSICCALASTRSSGGARRARLRTATARARGRVGGAAQSCASSRRRHRTQSRRRAAGHGPTDDG